MKTKNAKKSILASDAHRSPFLDHKDLHYYDCKIFADGPNLKGREGIMTDKFVRAERGTL